VSRGKLLLALLFFGLIVSAPIWRTHVTKPAYAQDTTSSLPFPNVDLIVNANRMVLEGRRTFRFDTFGDQAFWGDVLRLHDAIQGTRFGGVGAGLSPQMALALGLKVDVEALPEAVRRQILADNVDLTDPAVTLLLLRLQAVVGVTGFFNANGSLRSVGIQCALCHSTVDNSLAPGIGRRLDGWANRDLNIGRIISLAPNLQAIADLLGVDVATVRRVLLAWGPGKFDAQLTLDGKGFRPDGQTAATLIPQAFGLAGVNLHTSTGAWGSVPYWNAFVAALEMHGRGRFYDPRLNNAARFPIAARNGFGDLPHIPPEEDLITAKLPALQVYQLTIPVPKPQAGRDYNAAAARRGDSIFTGRGKCNDCHVKPLFTEPGWNLHRPAEVCVDGFQAERAPNRRYRTAPLQALFTHQKGGFYHDGRFATLRDVVNHYNSCLGLSLSEAEKSDLVQFLLSL
jgi:hypothetical protein